MINKTWIVLLACSLNVAIFVIAQSGTNIALPSMQQELGFNNEIQQWIINSFTLGSACTFIVFGRIAKIITSRSMYILGLVCMLLASLGCAFSYNETELLISRFVQGVAIAMTAPSAITLIRDSITDGKFDKYFSWFITINTSYFIIGPIIFGAIIEYISWRWNFLLIPPICILGIIAVYVTTPAKKPSPSHFDYLGSTLLCIGTFILIFDCMSIGFNGFEFSNIILLCSFLVISFFFIRHCLNHTDPIFPLQTLRDIKITSCAATGFTLQGSLMVIVFVSLLLLEHFKLTPIETGTFLMSTTFFGLISPAIAGRITTNANRKYVIILSFSMIIVAFMGLGISALYNSITACFVFAAMYAFFVGPILSALPSQISSMIHQDDVQETNAIVFHFRYLGASLCTAIMGVIAYGDSANSEDSITNIEFLHVMIFMSILIMLTIAFISKFMRNKVTN